MAINPSTNGTMSGRVTAADANFPYGSSKDETSPGAGDGTPYFKARADDILGLQQALLAEAGIVPSGNADNVTTSQYKEAMRTIFNVRTVTYDMASDANYTLTADQNRKRRVIITDTGPILSTGRDIIVDDMEKSFIAQNDTLQELTFKTSGGTGVVIDSGQTVELYNDGTNVEFGGGSGTVIGGATIVDNTDTTSNGTTPVTLANLTSTYVTKESNTKSKIIVDIVVPTAHSTATTGAANWCSGVITVKEDAVDKIQGRYGSLNTATAYGSVSGKYNKINHSKNQSIAYTTTISGIAATSLTNTTDGTLSPIHFEIREVLL